MASEVKSFRCTNCGASLEVPKGAGGKVTCPYCKTVCVIENYTQNAQIKEKSNINSGLPLTASQEQLHSIILRELTTEQAMPLDALENVIVLQEEHLCIPAYMFACNAMESFTYEVGNQRERVVDNKKETYTEWSQMSSMASATHTVVVSGNKEQEELVQELYWDLSPSSLVDVEELEFPADTENFSYDMPEVTAFSQYAKPEIEKQLQAQAKQQLVGKQIRSFNMGGVNIQKDSTVRILLGVFHLTYSYQDRTYELYVSADGSKVIASGHPVDTARKQLYETLQKDLEQLKGSGCGVLSCGIAALIGGIFFTPLLFLAAILILVGIRNLVKVSSAESAKKAEFKEFTSQKEEVVRAFIQRGKPLNGVYQNLQLGSTELTFAAANLYKVAIVNHTGPIKDTNEKTRFAKTFAQTGINKKMAESFFAGETQIIAESRDEKQAVKMQNELEKEGVEVEILPQI